MSGLANRQIASASRLGKPKRVRCMLVACQEIDWWGDRSWTCDILLEQLTMPSEETQHDQSPASGKHGMSWLDLHVTGSLFYVGTICQSALHFARRDLPLVPFDARMLVSNRYRGSLAVCCDSKQCPSCTAGLWAVHATVSVCCN